MATNKIGIQGETLTLYFDYELDGVPLAQASISDIEFQILDEGAEGSLKLTRSGETPRITITGEGTDAKYMAKLTQEETFALPQTVRYQIRIMDSGENVVADDVGVFTLGKALSKTPITTNT